VFSERERESVRRLLLERARQDVRIVAAAVTGSAARGVQDRWSDVDLFLAVPEAAQVVDALEEWTTFLTGELGALHSFDLRAGAALYRAFLLPSVLEVDVGFTPVHDFAARGEGGFAVVFGEPGSPAPSVPLDVDHLVGLSWHHVLHARTSLERGNLWQAEHWISGIRDHVLTLACVRHDLPTAYARGADLLPASIREAVRGTLVASLDVDEIRRALGAATHVLLGELEATAPQTAQTLRRPLLELIAP
jgi:predicted nucleotidyltransferase